MTLEPCIIDQPQKWLDVEKQAVNSMATTDLSKLGTEFWDSGSNWLPRVFVSDHHSSQW